MAPTTRSQAKSCRERSSRGDSLANLHSHGYSSSDDNKSHDRSAVGEEDDEFRAIIYSPTTKINYDISDLDLETRSEVRQIFHSMSTPEPPSLVLQWCQLNQEEQVYAFQLHEIVPRSIRIGGPSSKYRRPRCNCMTDSDRPCKHLVYFLDQLNYFTSDGLFEGQVQEPRLSGLSAGSEQCFESISNYHLDLLAANLHCAVGSPESRLEVDRTRLEETREMMVTIAEPDADDYAVQHYRADIFERQGSALRDHGIVTPSDLTKTIAQMLVTNNDFFAYFLKLLSPLSKARDPFRKVHQHVDRVLAELDVFARDSVSSLSASADGSARPRGVSWAAAHVNRAVEMIQYLLQNREDAPSPSERGSAARALVRILWAVVFDWNRDIPQSSVVTRETASTAEHNLYERLIGSGSYATSSLSPGAPPPFVIGTLAQLPEQNQWIETLEEIEARLASYSPPADYARRLRDLVILMRSSQPLKVLPPITAAATATSAREALVAESLTSSRAPIAVRSKRQSGDRGGRDGGVKRARS